MKRFKKAIHVFFMVLFADEFVVITTNKNNYTYDCDILLNHFRFISSEIITEAEGENSALVLAKDILKKSEENG